MNVNRVVDRVDRYQQRHKWLAFPFAVVKKFGDDRAGELAALMAYYGFFSLFPLLLVMVTGLGLVLEGNPELRQSILDTALAQFPVIGEDLREQPQAIEGSFVALGIGVATALWAGLGVTQAAQNAMNDVWDVPIKARPPFLEKRLRGLFMLAILGTLTLVTTGLQAVGAAAGRFSPLGLLVLAGSLLVNLVLYLLTFRILTHRRLSWGDVFPGAAVGAVAWFILQSAGTLIVQNQVQGASNTYGTFALVLGLLAWIYLGAQVTLYCAEINVVRVRRLWPRSITAQPPLTEGDIRTLEDSAMVEERIPEEDVEVDVHAPVEGPPMGETTGGPREQAEAPDRAARAVSATQAAVRHETDRAKHGGVASVTAGLAAVAVLGAAGVLALLAILFAAQAAAVALDGVMPGWAARLVVAGATALAIGAVVVFALPRLRRPPMSPVRAKQSVRDTLRWARRGFKGGSAEGHRDT